MFGTKQLGTKQKQAVTISKLVDKKERDRSRFRRRSQQLASKRSESTLAGKKNTEDRNSTPDTRQTLSDGREKPPASKTPAPKIPASKTTASKTTASKTPASKTPASKTPASKTKSTVASLLSGGDKRQKKVVYSNFSEFPMKDLEMLTEEIPEPASPNQIVIKVAASTVSYKDCLIRRGICFQVQNPTELPATPGSDVVGNIIKVGQNASHFNVGDRVACLVRTGGNARYISVDEEDVVEVPRSCDSAEAASMVSTYMSAYQALRLVTKDDFTLNGKKVLITGGIEPVGQALIQLCARAGAKDIYATAPTLRHRYVKSVLGAHPLEVQPNDWLPKTKGAMDVVFDIMCHDGLESPLASLKDEGILVSIGMSALMKKEKPSFFGAPLSAYWARLKGQMLPNTHTYEAWESFSKDKEAYKLDLEILFHLLKKRFIKPHIAKRIALSEVAEAQESLQKESLRGEIVCLPWKRLGTKK